MKNEKKANNSFFYFYFFIQENFYFLRKHIWKNLIYIVTFALSLFHVAGYCKCSNTNVHIYIHWFCRRHTLIQNTWQQTRYFYVDFDSNGVFLLFIYFGQVPSIQGKKRYINLDNQFHYKKYKERDRNISKTFVFIFHQSINMKLLVILFIRKKIHLVGNIFGKPPYK